MTLLSICQQVASEIPVAAPTFIVGNVDETALLLLALAQTAGEALARKGQNGWLAMVREHVFTTVAFPNIAGAVANTGAGGAAVITGLASTAGVVAGSFYAFGPGLANNSIVASVDSAHQVTLNQPAEPVGAGTFTFGQSDYPLPADYARSIYNTEWDRSRFWAMRGPQSPQQWQRYKSSILGRATVQRRFRIREINGQKCLSIDPVPTDNGSFLVYEYVSNAWCQSSTGTPQTTWQADTDVSVLDEWLIQRGVLYRALARLGMAYDDPLDEYNRESDKAVSRDGGAATLDMTPSAYSYLIGPDQVPETGFGA